MILAWQMTSVKRHCYFKFVVKCNAVSENLCCSAVEKESDIPETSTLLFEKTEDCRYLFYSTVMDKKKRIHLFNCDNTYDLFVVEALLRSVGEKLPFNITKSKHNFGLQNMTELCENTISRLQIDFAFFVIHANESRLSINENNVNIGYTKVYRALLQATGNFVSYNFSLRKWIERLSIV